MYLADWELAVASRPGFTEGEKKAMLLSNETLTGAQNHWYVCITLISTTFLFHPLHSIELGQYLLMLPGSSPLLSRRITQDPLEKFFGLQRQRGRTNENPNVQQFYKYSQALRVIQTYTTSVRGNCRGDTCFDPSSDLPLRRRR